MLATSKPTRTVERVLDGRPAAAAGLAPGDQISKIAGAAVTADEISKHINATEGRPFTIVVVRDGKTVTSAAAGQARPGRYRVGFQIEGLQGPGESVPTAVATRSASTGTITKLTRSRRSWASSVGTAPRTSRARSGSSASL